MVYTGGHRITQISWLEAGSILVRFATSYQKYGWQLYAGQCWIGTARNPLSRRIVGQLTPSHYPQHLRLVACDPADINTDHGPTLPPRPYNVVRVVIDTTGYPSSAKRLDMTAGTTPGGAVDDDNLQRTILLDGAATSHTLRSKPLGPGGSWNLEITPYDDSPPDGNAGTALALSQSLTVHPPDFAAGRFTAAATGGVLAVAATIPAD
jgi:hypothetical protein